MNKDFWMSKAPENSIESDIAHSNPSRSDLKRSQQWFMEGSESEFFPNKKQAVEIPNPNSYTALLNSNISNWGNSSTFQSQLFDDETPSISYSGIRKVKVNQVKEPESFTSVSLGHNMNDNNPYNNKDNNESITMGLSFNSGNNMLSMGDNSYISMGEPYNCHTVNKDNTNITTMTQSFIKEDENSMAMVAFNEHSNALLMEQVFNNDDTMSKSDSLSMRHSFGKSDNNIISFGGISDNGGMEGSGRLVCNHDFLMGQNSVQRLEENGFCESTSDALVVSGVQMDGMLKKKDRKGNKKTSTPNNFPTNVRSLLSTGMLDGIAVKYIAWSREKELRGVIQGAAYLCGCQSCTFSKAINAYEFERHAGCKTKHPNNHIYFENGKTIYGVVQELRNTPQHVLFDVIQTITGSPINQKSFRLWKESFLAATRELQRIYGKEEGKIVS